MGALVKWKRSFYKKFLKMGVISPKIMILLDGGICSQMHQYLIKGNYIEIVVIRLLMIYRFMMNAEWIRIINLCAISTC